MTFVVVGHDDSSHAAAGDRDSAVAIQAPARQLVSIGGGGGHYRPAAAATGAGALHWVPFATAVSTTRALLAASHEDLRLRGQQLSRALGGTFFHRDAATATSPFGGGGARFPEDGLYVCTELLPLWPVLHAVQRALLRLAVNGAGDGPCDCYYDIVGWLMYLLVGDAGAGRGPAVFDREKFRGHLRARLGGVIVDLVARRCSPLMSVW
ncbi:unnamed protein product [Urochloa humidicola]